MHLVAGMGNVYIDLGHVIVVMFPDVEMVVTKLYQMIQYVVCTLIIALKYVSYLLRF